LFSPEESVLSVSRKQYDDRPGGPSLTTECCSEPGRSESGAARPAAGAGARENQLRMRRREACEDTIFTVSMALF